MLRLSALALSLIWANLVFDHSPCLGAEWLVPTQFPTIQEAINAAQSGDQILVSPGTYEENLNFNGKDVAVISTSGPLLTSIDGSALTQGPTLGSTVTFSSGETTSAILNGFSIQGGTGILLTDAVGTYRRGGGIHVSASSPTIENCILTNNSSDFGSGIYAQGTLSLTLQNLQIMNNSGLEGSGLYLIDCGVVSVEQCDISGNQAMTAGGAISINTCTQVNLRQNTLTSNTALIGGGVYCRLSGFLFENNEVRSNEATLLGGGITLYQSTSTCIDSVFVANTANHGGGIGLDGGTLIVDKCLLTGNIATTAGAAVGSTINLVGVEIHRSTLALNSSPNGSPGVFYPPLSAGGASSTLILSHSILWNPTGLEIDIPTFSQVDHSVVSSGYPGTSVLVSDPLFQNTTAENFSLDPISPAIDAGDDLLYTDPDGTPPDLGAYYYDQRPPALPPLTCQLEDPCGTAVSISWDVGVQVPDSLQLSVGTDFTQLVPLAALPGTASGYTFDPGSSGLLIIGVEPVSGGLTPEMGPTYCEIDIPPPAPQIPILNLLCSFNPQSCAGDLSWTNGATYSSIELIINGQSLLLPGSVNSANLPLTPGEPTTLQLIPQTSCGAVLAAVECQLLCPIPAPRFIRGDANMDSTINLADVTSQLDHLYQLAPASCQDSMDSNDDGILDISDPVFLLLFLFDNGQPPPAPTLSCDTDPDPADSLDCQNGLNCP